MPPSSGWKHKQFLQFQGGTRKLYLFSRYKNARTFKNAKIFYGGNGKVGNGKVGNGKVTPWVHTIHHIDTWLCRRDLHHGICIFLCREALPCSHTSEVPCLLLLPQVAMSRQASMYHHSESTHILLVVECSAGVGG